LSSQAQAYGQIREAQRAGASSLRAIAEVLNARGVRTARGGKWAATQVRDMFAANSLTCAMVTGMDAH
jgi:hypothetical protein